MDFEKIILDSEKSTPLICLHETSPAIVSRYLNDAQKVVIGKVGTQGKFDKIIDLIGTLHRISASGEETISVTDELAPQLSVSKSTILRIIKDCTKLGVMRPISVRKGKTTYSAYVTCLPDLTTQDSNASKSHPSLKHQTLVEELSASTLHWAEDYKLKDQRHLLYGKNLMAILIRLFQSKPDPEKKKVVSTVDLNGITLPAVLSCNVNTTLPESSDALYYLATLECVKSSLKENVSRAGGMANKLLKTSQYQVPINSIIEQLGKEVNGTARDKCIKALLRLDGAKVSLNELPESELYDNTDSFFSFQPLSNLSVMLSKKIDGKNISGKGQSIAIFALPDFIIESIIQSIRSDIDTESYLDNLSSSLTQSALIEELLEIPSDWVKGKLDVLTECLMLTRSAANQSMNWTEIYRHIDRFRSPNTLKLAVMKKAISRGGEHVSKSIVKLSYMNWIAELNDKGISITRSETGMVA
ncbi:hypothetical protein [Shewanella colwelliana]|uniref:hypothetical protein n=1 Tax=Shewanella colwelliana TaxID=23 RepID=UPI0022AF544B|nr:hypothetical protein [Shewanella colwelliana]MCZ4339740.1 hypothetical protein [Shewanella colwelliana]